MITLRKNQVEPISKATAFFKEKRPAPSLIVLPTAWGKSILTAFVANEIEDKLLVIQPSKELLEQNYKKYVSLCGDFGAQAGVYSASFGRKDINKITYATIGSIKKIGKTFKQLGFKKMLIDEAHLYPREADSMLGQFLEDSEISHVLGITATPIKLQANTGLNGERFSKLVMLTSRSKKGNFFKDIVHVSQVQEMIDLGFWSKLVYKTSGFDSSQLVYNSSKSEFTEDSMQRAFAANDIHNQIKQELDVNSDRKHILAFVPSIDEAIQFSQEYPNSAAIYSGMHASERERVISEFRKGNIRVIFNVRVLSTGFDYTKIDCIILGISTASIALYYQICVDLETEILTQRGFLRHNEMSYNDKAAAFEPETGKIVWADIENITHRKVHPSEKFVSYKNPHLDFKVTDEHDLLVRGKGRSDNKNYKPYRKMKAIDVPNMTQGIYMPVSGIMESDGAPLTDYEVRFIGYLLSDGNLNKTNNAIAITQSLRYPEVIADIEDVLNGCGFKYGKILRKRKGEESKYLDVYHFTVSKGMPRGTDTDKRGWANLGKYIGGCKTWLDAYEEFNERQFDLLLESINKADGAKNEHADYNVKSYTIAMGINREYADKFQSLAVRRGYRCNMYTSKQNENKQYIMHLKKQTYSTIAGSKMKDEYLHGKMQHREHIAVSSSCNDDEVWCIKNSVGTIITRRNGKVLIMGNCGRGTRIDDEKENCLISDLAGNVDRFGKVEDITFEKERIWKMYGTGGRLLSGIPIHEIGTIKKGDAEKEVLKSSSNIGKPLETMPFGKHKGENFKDIPKEYKEWMLKSFDWHAANMNLKQAIEGSL